MIDTNTFVKDRRKALLSLNRFELEKFYRKYLIPIPPRKYFWVAVHKARCECTDLPEEEIKKSQVWLVERGFYPGIGVFDPDD